MRPRSEEKRRQIVAVAADMFAERGFDGTSIDDIVQKVGGSKTTIYSLFGSKDGILDEVLTVDLDEWIGQMADTLLGERDLNAGLSAFGIAYLTRMLGMHAIGHLRIGTAQSTRSAIGGAYYRRVLKPAWQALAGRFGRLMDQKRLVRSDPWTVAMHWKGLAECELCERRLLGDLDAPDADEIARAATGAASALLSIYGNPSTAARRRP